MKNQEQRSSFITIAINNANSTAAAADAAEQGAAGASLGAGVRAGA